MAMEKRQTVHGRRHIHLDLLEALHQHDIFQNAGRGLAVHVRQLEAVPVQVDRMSVIRLIVEHQAIALALLKRSRLRFFIEAAPLMVQRLNPPLPPLIFPNTSGIVSSGFWNRCLLGRRACSPRPSFAASPNAVNQSCWHTRRRSPFHSCGRHPWAYPGPTRRGSSSRRWPRFVRRCPVRAPPQIAAEARDFRRERQP